MVQRDQVENLEVPSNKELRDVLFELDDSPSRRAALLKDAHLLEAALVFERRVASIERIARSWFARASATYQPIASICWVNPDTEYEAAMDWLQRGAPLEKALQLGTFREQSAATNIPKKKRKP